MGEAVASIDGEASEGALLAMQLGERGHKHVLRNFTLQVRVFAWLMTCLGSRPNSMRIASCLLRLFRTG